MNDSNVVKMEGNNINSGSLAPYGSAGQGGIPQVNFLAVAPLKAEVAGIPAGIWAQLSHETRLAVLKDLKLL